MNTTISVIKAKKPVNCRFCGRQYDGYELKLFHDSKQVQKRGICTDCIRKFNAAVDDAVTLKDDQN